MTAKTDLNLRGLLMDCWEKLELYREAHSGEYLGGVEYTVLVKRIESALAALKPRHAAACVLVGECVCPLRTECICELKADAPGVKVYKRNPACKHCNQQ